MGLQLDEDTSFYRRWIGDVAAAPPLAIFERHLCSAGADLRVCRMPGALLRASLDSGVLELLPAALAGLGFGNAKNKLVAGCCRFLFGGGHILRGQFAIA